MRFARTRWVDRVLPLLLLIPQLSGCATSAQLRPRDQQRIAGKTFVVTGASSGFGRGVALALASHGLSADIAHKWQIETAPPAPPTPGTLHEPMDSGRAVEGGVRKRMAEEDAARKRTKQEGEQEGEKDAREDDPPPPHPSPRP